jgi:sugar lactone lactonase YvrE
LITFSHQPEIAMKLTVFSICRRYLFPILFIIYQTASAQTWGTISLPASLCDQGVTVQKAALSTPSLNRWCEGPVVAPNGTLFFSEQLSGNIWKVSPAGVMTKLVNIGSYSNGMDFNPVSGRLVVCEKSQIAERDTATGAVLSVVVTDNSNLWTAGGSGGSNDLTFASNGDLFFTSWNQRLYFHSADGTVNKDWNFPSSYGTCNWNGIEYIEEKGIIYVCQYGKNRVVSFNVDPSTHLIDTGSLKPFGPAINAPDGITVDSNYNVYVCSNSAQGSYPNSVVVLDSSGAVLGTVRMKQSNGSVAVNCVFGTSTLGSGANARTLYVTGDSGAFRIQLKVPGRIPPKTAVAGAPFRERFNHDAKLPYSTQSVRNSSHRDMHTRTIDLFNLRGVKLSAMALPSGLTIVKSGSAAATCVLPMAR